MNTALTSRDIASMTAHAAGIKAENEAYTQGRLRAGRSVVGLPVDDAWLFDERGDAIGCAFRTVRGTCEQDARRLAACWNACIGIPTETLESTAHWGAVINHTAPSIPAEAARIGAGLDSESLEQGEPA